MAHKLKSITIEGYKSLRGVTVELRDLNVLIGANGAGKSNLISAFGMVREMVEGRLGVYVARRGGANALLCALMRGTSRPFCTACATRICNWT